MAADSLDEFRIAKLELKPGDVLVVNYPKHLRPEECDWIRRHVRDAVGPTHNILVLTGGLELAVLTRAEIEARV